MKDYKKMKKFTYSWCMYNLHTQTQPCKVEQEDEETQDDNWVSQVDVAYAKKAANSVQLRSFSYFVSITPSVYSFIHVRV